MPKSTQANLPTYGHADQEHWDIVATGGAAPPRIPVESSKLPGKLREHGFMRATIRDHEAMLVRESGSRSARR